MISIQMRVLTVGLLLMTGVLQAVEPETILVMGASGRQGNAVVDELLLRGYAVRGMTRKPQGKKAQRLADKGVTVVQGDYADKDSVLAAMTGVQKAFFYSGFSRDELQEGRNVIAAAKQSGIRHLIYSSGAAAAPEGGMKDVVKAQVELALRDSGVPFSVVRPVAFMENFKGQQKRTIDNGVIDSRAPDRYVYFITIPDIGFFVGEAFDNPDEWLGRAENIAADKMAIAGDLDALGVDYVEGGWPGANPTDDAFFAVPPTLKQARLTAFGMTRRAGRSAENDPGVATLLDVGTPAVCIVGKTWDFQARVALGVEEDENRAMIADTIRHAAANTEETLFDAEHFFDGYKSDADFAMRCAEAALEAGARWIVLCDTNGGTLPEELGAITGKVVDALGGKNIGIHCHDDTGNAVANSLAAVAAGACQVQGTLNGLGERCGNANLISVIPNLVLKMGLDAGIPADGLSRLTHISRLLDERLNRAPDRSAPFVGESAFAHKGGLHVSGIEKDPRCYEHIEPETVGNHRHIVVSDQSGRANVLARFREIGIEIDSGDKRVGALVELVKQREFDGYSYDGADASFELLAQIFLAPQFPGYR